MTNDIVKIIAKENLDEAAEIIEVGLDKLLDDGVIKDLPMASTILGIIKTISNVREALFLKKIAKFLFELNELKEEEKENFLSEMSEQPKLRRKVGEKILLLLERSDDMDKPSIIARLFAAYVRGEIDYQTFSRLSDAVNNANIADLKRINDRYNNVGRNDRLVSAGLMRVVGIGSEHSMPSVGLSNLFNYDLTEDGKIFTKHCLK